MCGAGNRPRPTPFLRHGHRVVAPCTRNRLMDDISKLMIDQLRDIHSAERQALRAMPRMMKNATH